MGPVIRFGTIAAAVLTAAVAGPAHAEEAPRVHLPPATDKAAPPDSFTVSGYVSLVSQYRGRGITVSDNKPAAQASATLAHESGLYLGVWASSARAGNSTVNFGGAEIDIYGGYAGPLGNTGLDVDVALLGYFFPDVPLANYYEVHGSLARQVGPATAKLGIYYAPHQPTLRRFAPRNVDNTYIYGEVSSAIPGVPLSVMARLGYNSGALNYTREYLDYTVGVTATWRNLALNVSLVGTDITRADAQARPLYPSAEETYRAIKPVPVVSLTASF